MKIVRQFLSLFLCVSLSIPMAQAAIVSGSQQDMQSAKVSQEDLTIIIHQEQVRFMARKAVTEMQLQIFDQTGQMVYDSGVMAQQELAWAFRQAGGEAVKSGVYAYTLTVKEADAETPRVRRGHFIVDRAKERDSQTDRLWVTSQNDSSIGADLTVARNESAIIAGAAIPRERNSEEVAAREVPARDTSPDAKLENRVDLAAAVSGTAGRIAKFTSTTNVGNSVMTELNGKIGVGITAPLGKLEVFGNWNGQHGALTLSGDKPSIRFSGGSVSGSQQWLLHEGSDGNGTLAFFNGDTTGNWKYVLAMSPGGNVGIGTGSLNAPYRLQVVEDFPAAEIGGAVYGVSLNNKGILGQTTNGVGVMGLASDSGMAGHFVGKVGVQGDVFPTFDGYRLGTPTRRWSAVYAVNGTIQTSDARMKKGIADLRYGLKDLMQLRPVSFQWKDDSNGQQHLGFIAQETQQVIPEAVVQPAEADSTLGMNYSTLIPVVIKSIQEQQGELDTLKSSNEALQLRNADLKQQNADLETRLQAVEKLVKQLTGKKTASKVKN